MVFIHGYGNSFDAAALTTGEICRSLQNQFVCIVLTWPAGGSGGFFFGYNIDRESSEFSVADLKKAIRIIAETQGLERLHLLAHSRGTDVLASVVQQLSIEAYVSQSSMWQRYKIANVVFFAPDIDLDVASSKMFAWVSDPDLASATNQGRARSRLKALCISRFIRLQGTKRWGHQRCSSVAPCGWGSSLSTGFPKTGAKRRPDGQGLRWVS